MKKFKIAMCLFVGTLFLYGCSSTLKENIEDIEETAAPETTETTISPSGEGEVIERDVRDGKVRSYLTGQWIDEEIGNRRPVAVMLNNLEAAQPMSGISKADIVYECVVEGSLTRLMGIFEDYDDLEKIGSVRSCRDYFVYYALEYDAIYAHIGQAVYAQKLLESEYVNNLSGLSEIGSTVYYRISDRKAPHNAYASAQGIKAGIEKLGYKTQYREGYDGKFLFAKDGEEALSKEKESAKLVKPGYLVNKPWFEYDENDKLYYRFQYGAKQVDELDGRQLAYKNIILQYATWQKLDSKDYLAFNCHMGGEVKYISDGKVTDGYWMRHNGDEGPIKYYDADLKEITINQGKTWICVIQDTFADKVVIE